MMQAYAATTTTKKNLAYLRKTGWGIMVSPKGPNQDRPAGMRYALDNGAWWAHATGRPFDASAFMRALDKLWFEADFIVLPDIVAGGLRSLDFSLEWYDRLKMDGQLLLAVQDGMEIKDVAPYVGELGLFIGGSTEWKEKTLFQWGELATQKGNAYIHCGRVNSQRRLNLCKQAGIDSFDGSGPAKFLKHAEVMNRELAQHSMRFRGW